MSWYHRGLRPYLLLAAVFFLPLAAGASEPAPTTPAALAPGEPGRVAAFLDGRTLQLDDTREVRLPAIADEGTVDLAVALLESLTAGRSVLIHRAQPDPDRHGRLVAHVVVEGGPWLQAELVGTGAARVYPAPGETALAATLLRLERTARRERVGLWDDPAFRIRNPSEAWDDRGTFQIVEGRVVDAAIVRGTGYLNFATDWRRDFTFALDREALRAFRRAGIDITTLVGRRVRGRGWVRLRNGPMIDLSEPAQLEVLGED